MNGKRYISYEHFFNELRKAFDRKAKRETEARNTEFSFDTEFPRAYFLGVLGNAIATERGWLLELFEAIEYAIILKTSWHLDYVRSLPCRDKWLALHEEWCAMKIPQEAMSVWLKSEEAPQFVDIKEIWMDTCQSEDFRSVLLD